MIITANNLRKSYRTGTEQIQVLTGLDLTIDQGEIVAVMGASGSGKSTLLHILGLIDTFDSGELAYDDVPVTPQMELAEIRARRLGFVFQYHHLLPEFTVTENLLIPQSLIGIPPTEARRRAAELLSLLNLSDRADHYPSQISGGEKQRVALLRALVNRPGIVLADEPTGNLDMDNSQKLLDFVGQLRENFQTSFLIATHDRQVAEVADRVLFLDSGKLTSTN